MPAVARFAHLVRLAGADLAAERGFDYDQVQDVRMALGEAIGVLLGRPLDPFDPEDHVTPIAGDEPGGRLQATFTTLPDGLSAQISLVGAARMPEVADLSEQILDATSAGHTIDLGRPAGPTISVEFERETDGEK